VRRVRRSRDEAHAVLQHYDHLRPLGRRVERVPSQGARELFCTRRAVRRHGRVNHEAKGLLRGHGRVHQGQHLLQQVRHESVTVHTGEGGGPCSRAAVPRARALPDLVL